MFKATQKNYAWKMPWIPKRFERICINCFAHVSVNGDSLLCLTCEELPKADVTPSAANPEQQPTYAQMQTLINEIRDIKKSVNGLRWFMWGMFLSLLFFFVVVGVTVNLSPTLFAPLNG